MSDQKAGMVIVGAGMAGARACMNLRANGYEGEITLIGEEALMPYDKPPLSKSAITTFEPPEPTWLMDREIAASLKTNVHLDTGAVAIDRGKQNVKLSNGKSIAYDKLLIATGAKPRVMNCLGGHFAHTLRNFSDTLKIRAAFQPQKKITIIGGGFIGLELASSAIKRGCFVTLIEAQSRILLRGVPEAIAKIVHERHVAAGVHIILGIGIAHLTATHAYLQDGRVIAADMIIAGIGAEPETQLAAGAGLAIDNGIACDANLQTNDPNIFAAGDCCSFIHNQFEGQRLRLEAWRNAHEQAQTAAENMLGGNKQHQAVPWFWSDQYDLSLQIAGIAAQGPNTVTRYGAQGAVIVFHLAKNGTLRGASGIGIGNAIARDIKMAEMMITKKMTPDAADLADPSMPLKSMLKGKAPHAQT